MGSLQSQTSINISDSYFKMVTDITASSVATYSGSKAQINNATVNICLLKQCGPSPPCNASFTIVQTNELQETLDIEALSKVTADVKSKIVSQTIQWAQQQSSSTQGWLDTAFSVQIQTNENVQSVAETIANSISSDTIKVCNDFTFEENNVVINACGTLNDQILVGQSNATRSATSCIAKQILNVFVSNSEFASGIQKADQQALSDQQGLFGWIEYIAAAVCLVIIIFLVIHLAIHLTGGYKPKPSATQSTAAGGGLPPGTRVQVLGDGTKVATLPNGAQVRVAPHPVAQVRAHPTSGGATKISAGSSSVIRRAPMPLPTGLKK